MLLVETEIYGLVSGPSWFRASLTVDLSAGGYVKIRMTNVCSYSSQTKTLLKAARAWRIFDEKYQCGKSFDLWSVGREWTLFAGHHDYRVAVSMDGYVRLKLRPIEVPKSI